MNLHLEPGRDLGLQYVLENGLALLKGSDRSGVSRDGVFDALVEVFETADRGSQSLGSHLLVDGNQMLAVERFSVFFRYLKDAYGDDLQRRLAEATSVLEAVRNGTADTEKRERTIEFIAAFLDALQRETALAPLIAPSHFEYI